MPHDMSMVLGDGEAVSSACRGASLYFGVAREQFQGFLSPLPTVSVGQPCGHCGVCRWSEHCEAEWERLDHLSLVANITRGQRETRSGRDLNHGALGALDRVPYSGHAAHALSTDLARRDCRRKAPDGKNRWNC